MKLLLSSILVLASLTGTVTWASETREYVFKVFLEDREIGSHHFIVTRDESRTLVTSEARFDVKVLFFKAYSYQHSNREVWQDDCLRAIDATTNDNGDRLFVRGELYSEQLQLRTPDGEQTLEGCIATFAYWDPELLDRDRLLDPQSGELVRVDLQPLGESSITVDGQRVAARRYRLHNPELDIDLWYSRNDEWLALESTTPGGERLRYRVQ